MSHSPIAEGYVDSYSSGALLLKNKYIEWALMDLFKIHTKAKHSPLLCCVLLLDTTKVFLTWKQMGGIGEKVPVFTRPKHTTNAVQPIET